MEYRDLGKTGLRVSLLGLGAVAFGRTEGLKYPTAPRLPSMRELADLLAVALELGINLIDTAPAYGASEARIGKLLAGQRNDWVLCTKVGEIFEAGRSRYDFTPEHTRGSVQNSLTLLATDHLDVVLVHSNGDDIDIIENRGTLQVLAQLKHEGLIRAFGISHHTVAGGMAAIETCDVVMATLNRSVTEQLDLIERAHARGCGVLIKKALDSGNGARNADSLRHNLAFVAKAPGVSSIVVGTTNPLHLRADAQALD